VGVCGDVVGGEDFVERSGQRHEPAWYWQREPLRGYSAHAVDVDEPGTALLVLLAKAVMQRGSGISHAFAECLSPVDVAECDVVGSVEHVQRYNVEPALTNLAFEAVGRFDASRKAVRDRDRTPRARRHIG